MEAQVFDVALRKNIQIETEAVDLVTQAKAIQVTDDASLIAASTALRNTKGLMSKISAFFAPMKDAAHKAHKAITSAEGEQLKPLMEVEALLKGRVNDYQREQARLAEIERRRLQKLADDQAAEQRKQLEDARLEQAAKLEAAGKPADAERVIAQTIAAPQPPAPVITMARPTPKIEGISTRKVTKFRVIDLSALLIHIVGSQNADGTLALENLITVNDKAIRAMVTAQGKNLRLPGVEVYEESEIAVRA